MVSRCSGQATDKFFSDRIAPLSPARPNRCDGRSTLCSVTHVVVIALLLPAGSGTVTLLAEIGIPTAGLVLAGGVVALLSLLLLQGALTLLLLLAFLLALPLAFLGNAARAICGACLASSWSRAACCSPERSRMASIRPDRSLVAMVTPSLARESST